MRRKTSGSANLLVALLVMLACAASGADLAKAEQTDTPPPYLLQSAREIPVAYDVDVVVVGGSVGAVAAAVQARKQGRSVLLVTLRTYLGEDIVGMLRLEYPGSAEPPPGLTAEIFPPLDPTGQEHPLSERKQTTPLRVKKILADALLQAEVDFLFGCFVTDVLRDQKDQPAGVVIANRAGRQAVLAKVIIDATDRAWVARQAGAKFRPWPSEELWFEHIVLFQFPPGKGEVQTARRMPRLATPDGSYRSLAEVEHKIKDATYIRGQLRASELIRCSAHDTLIGKKTADRWQAVTDPESFKKNSLGHFQPADVPCVFVLSWLADLPMNVRKDFNYPETTEMLGRIIGQAASELAASIDPQEVSLPAAKETSTASTDHGEIREILRGLRPTSKIERTIHADATAIPVFDDFDVVVAGGGTSGACAAIGAARRGARVLVVEFQHGLGGVGTLGMIGKPYHGVDSGFTREVPFPVTDGGIEWKMEWFRREIRKAGGEIWLGSLACGAVVQKDGRVRGLVVATPESRGVVLADVVIDSTGSADVAVAAGADSLFAADQHQIAMQGAGLPKRPLGASYVNSDYLLVDEADMIDTWRALVGAGMTMGDSAFDIGSFLQTRERRRVLGEHVLTYLDQIAGREYDDSIAYSKSDYDSHGYPTQPYFALLPHTESTLKANHPAPGGACYTPYRCLLPRGLRGILVTGLGISMERDASAMVRMQRDLHNQGYAAGVAASMASEADVPPREIDLAALQRHLVEIGNLPPAALAPTRCFPLPDEEVAQAVLTVGRTEPEARNAAAIALAVVLTHEDVALPKLRKAYAQSTGESRLRYAKILAMLGRGEAVGDRSPVEDLIAALKQAEWDAKILQGRMAEYAHLPTPVDGLVLALGRAKAKSALPVIFEKMERLDANSTLSHHRAVALALESIGDPSAAEPLAALLAKPGMTGNWMLEVQPLYNEDYAKRRRTAPLREIVLARALYRCGDHQGIGQAILREYQKDLRGLFARHAMAVLGE